jgi:hypothetical protein
MTLFLGSRPNCCRRPALGICWSIDFDDPDSGYTAAGAHAYEPVAYHLLQIDERSGLIQWDRTVPDWVGTFNTIATYLPGYSVSDWVIETDGEAIQQQLDRWAPAGSLAVDPSGAWAVFGNRRRMIVGESTLDEVWDGHPDNTGSESDCRAFSELCYYDNPKLHPGGLAWRLGGSVYGGNLPPFDSTPAPTSATLHAYSGHREGYVYRGNGELCRYWNNSGQPHLTRFNGSTATHQQLFTVYSSGPPIEYYYRSYFAGFAAMADGSLIAYQNNDPVRTIGEAVTGNNVWEFAKYNDSVVWATGTDVAGVFLGANTTRTAVGVIWQESTTELNLVLCDQSGTVTTQIIDIPEDYPVTDWSHFGYNAIASGARGAMTPVWSPRGNALLFLFRGVFDGPEKFEYVAAKYDLDAAEWRWFRPIPNETGLPITAWSMAAKSQ